MPARLFDIQYTSGDDLSIADGAVKRFSCIYFWDIAVIIVQPRNNPDKGGIVAVIVSKVGCLTDFEIWGNGRD